MIDHKHDVDDNIFSEYAKEYELEGEEENELEEVIEEMLHKMQYLKNIDLEDALQDVVFEEDNGDM